MRIHTSIGVLLVGLVSGLTAAGRAEAANCNGSTQNKAKITIGSSVNTIYTQGGTVSLTANVPASNPAPPVGQYNWSQVSGPAVTFTQSSGTTGTFIVPQSTSGHTGAVVIRLTVTGAQCDTPVPATDTATIQFANIDNYPPVAVPTASATSVSPGTSVSLIGTGSYDPDGDAIEYAWTQVALPGVPAVTLLNANGATAGFVAPPVAQTTTFRFRLTVTENAPFGDELFGSATIDINVLGANQPPTAVLSCPAEIGEGETLTLDGSGSSDTDGTLAYAFAQDVGFPIATLPPAPHGSSISFAAPSLGGLQPGNVKFLLTVTDDDGASDSDDCTVFILDKTAPVIDGATDMLVAADDANGAYASFDVTWTDNVDGGPNPATCSPVSGSLFALGQTTVECSATDSSGNSASASFTVTVTDQTAPVIASRGDEIVEATSAAGAISSYAPPATTDNVDADGVASCEPAPGSLFAIGSTPVVCNASDAAGNAAIPTGFNVVVADTTAPEITPPADVTVEATGPLTFVDPGTATATDAVGPVTITSDAPADNLYPVGVRTIEWKATDAYTNSSIATSTVTVTDTTPPTVTASGDLVAEATGPSGAAVSFAAATATDLVDGSVAATCDASSGAVFPLGVTTVTCSATDAAGNTGSDSFTITVQDTTPPSIAPHANVVATATSGAGAIVNYTLPTASDLVDGSVPVSCTPASGAQFPLGATTVNCSATDAAGNTGSSSFTVTVSFAFNGFFRPIDNLPVVNKVKAGQSIPVKFSLGGDMGLNIFAAGYPKSVVQSCSSGAATDDIEETVTAGGSSLSYDPLTGQYNYVWKTDKGWAGQCRQLIVKFADGNTQVANFNFTR